MSDRCDDAARELLLSHGSTAVILQSDSVNLARRQDERTSSSNHGLAPIAYWPLGFSASGASASTNATFPWRFSPWSKPLHGTSGRLNYRPKAEDAFPDGPGEVTAAARKLLMANWARRNVLQTALGGREVQWVILADSASLLA